jgi:hypothetical protein
MKKLVLQQLIKKSMIISNIQRDYDNKCSEVYSLQKEVEEVKRTFIKLENDLEEANYIIEAQKKTIFKDE